MFILLDSGVLGYLSNPTPASSETIECNEWLEKLLVAKHTVCLPEIVDYEQRRVFIHLNMAESVVKLDALKKALAYLPITTEAMLQAAQFWADARKNRKGAIENKKLDVDMILAAQAKVSIKYAPSVIIATTNVRDLKDFADARLWRDIPTN